MKKKNFIAMILFLFVSILLAEPTADLTITNKIGIRIEKELVCLELILKNNTNEDFKTTPFGFNHNSLAITSVGEKKVKLTIWKDEFKKNVNIKQGEIKIWQLKLNDLKEDIEQLNLNLNFAICRDIFLFFHDSSQHHFLFSVPKENLCV